MRKISSLLLAITICFTLAACGNDMSHIAADVPDINETIEAAPGVDMGKNPIDQNDNQDDELHNNAPDRTVGQILLEEFEIMLNENPEMTISEVMETLRYNPVIEFMSEISEVQPGILEGFTEKEIIGFKEGVVLRPTIITIPFVAYVFELSVDSDVEGFKEQLRESADLEWNEIVAADEIFVSNIGNVVLCVMSPYYFES